MKQTKFMNRVDLKSLRMLTLVGASLAFFNHASFAADWDGRVMEIERKMDVSKNGTFQFSVPVGSVVIENHDYSHIEYSGTFKAKNSREADRVFPRLEEKSGVTGDRTEFVIQWKGRKAPKSSGLSGQHRLKLPKAIHVEITSAGGSIKMGDRGGSVVVTGSGGSIRVGEILGPIKATTSGGSITIKDCGGDAALNSSGGSIKTGDVNGSLVANTSGGSIQVGNIAGNFQANTSGGSIHATLESQISKPMNLKTSGGSIHVRVKPDFQATLDAKTSGGRVICDLPLKVAGKFSKKSIHGAVNGGGPKVTLRTSGGSIRLSEI